MRRIGLWFLFFSAAAAEGQDRHYGRSMVMTRQGIVSTSQTLASQAGAQVLARGGGAVDAAIAANAVLAVTQPMLDGIGGDLFVLYWEASSGKLYGLNASGWTPKALDAAALKRKGLNQMPRAGIHTVTVPGVVDGWKKLHTRFGKLPWKELFHSSVYYAAEGFPVTEMIQAYWKTPASPIDHNDESRRVFRPGGRTPEPGEIFRNPELARAMRLIAAQGPDAFYRGEIAKAILRTSDKLGGLMNAADLAEFSSEWVEPISSTYRGWKVYEMPPNSQGVAALQMLNLLETFPPSPAGPHSAEELHKKIEAMKLAYADLRPYVGDPRFFRSPVAGMLSKEYARERAARIDLSKARCDTPAGTPVASDTTYLAVVDKDGNIASWIQSVAGLFGSGVTVEGMGILLHNRGAGFELEPGSPRLLAGRKRPFHTIIPAFLEHGDLRIGFGIMGGPNQPLAHAQFVSNVVDYGMNIQAALEAPRFTKRGSQGCEVQIESRAGLEALSRLSSMGHIIDIRQEHSYHMGHGAAVLHNRKTGVNFGAADSRADGSAEPEPAPQ
jgi:gamma-glutamyltranspeptidase/glutathione hydrolase